MLDLIYVLATVALFALVALVARGGREAGPTVRRLRPARSDGWRGPGMTFFTILAVVLAVAALVYLVVALVNPERF